MWKPKLAFLTAAVMFALLTVSCVTTGDLSPSGQEIVEEKKQVAITWAEEFIVNGRQGETISQYIRRVICTEPYKDTRGSFIGYMAQYKYYDCKNYTVDKT